MQVVKPVEETENKARSLGRFGDMKECHDHLEESKSHWIKKLGMKDIYTLCSLEFCDKKNYYDHISWL